MRWVAFIGCALGLLTSCSKAPTPTPAPTEASTPIPTIEPTPTPAGVTSTFGQAAYLGNGFRWPYRLHVQFDGTDPTADAQGCFQPVEPGRTILKFSGWIENLTTDRPAPNPNLKFDTNLKDLDNPLDKKRTSFDDLVLVFGDGQKSDVRCIDADHYGDAQKSIPQRGRLEFAGVIYAAPDPPLPGTNLKVEVDADDIADLKPQKVIALNYTGT